MNGEFVINMEENVSNFLYDIIDEDLAEGRADHVHTRFPPEPNGYLHIGSLKAIWINHSIARRYNGEFNLRYDDTNPVKEDDEYVRSIYEDICWLGAKPDHVFYGSDYFDICCEQAFGLIRKGLAYVCDLSAEEMKEYRGTLTEPGKPSPWRERSVEENLDLFTRMKNGEFPEGSRTLRAKIDMASPNINMRDPAIYRIVYASHHRQGDKWCIYPLYDFAHPIQDAVEGITHSLCSIEFENHRPLYDWVVENCDLPSRPKQREFARLNVTNTVMSKRYLRSLVENGLVDGWDDPRMPTICGLRRRGYTPSSLTEFVRRAGVAKTYSLVDQSLLEACLRDELNVTAPRRVAVLDPLKVVITNWPEGKVEYFELPNNVNDPEAGTRKLAFTGELWIEREDFALVPPPKFFRLKPGGEVRLMGAYIVKCESVETDENGVPVKVLCTADLETGNGNPADGRKVKGTIHWLCAETAQKRTVRLYERLFTKEDMNDLAPGETFGDYLDTDSVRVLENCYVEPALADAKAGERFQFVRTGYFCADSKYPGSFNRIVTLRDSKGK